jgi:hypothetical protein
MRTLLTVVCLLGPVALARADAPVVDFGGQRYYLAYEDQAKLASGEPGDGIAEFTLQGETVDNWTKLFAYFAYPQSGDDPTLAAVTLGKVVKETNKDANFAIVENRDTGEAIIDFLTWTPGSDVMEFNVFKYARANNRPGLVALQFAQRLKAGDVSVKEMRALRARSVEQMARTDIAPARDYFASRIRTWSLHEPSSGKEPDAQAGGER